MEFLRKRIIGLTTGDTDAEVTGWRAPLAGVV
jgi:hypothetical protein